MSDLTELADETTASTQDEHEGIPILAIVPASDPDMAVYESGSTGVPDDVRHECEHLWAGVQRTAYEALRIIRDKLAPYGTFNDCGIGPVVNYNTAKAV